MAEVADVKQLADVNDTIIGVVENGPWVLIENPELRRVVGEYVADACHTIAVDAGLTEAMEYAHNALPQRLDTTSQLVTPDARQRLARHLYEQAHLVYLTDPHPWGVLTEAERLPWLRQADHALNTITGTEN